VSPLPSPLLHHALTPPSPKVAEHQTALNAYLQSHLLSTPVRSLEDLIAWNAAHPDLEFPPNKGDQSILELAVTSAQDGPALTAMKIQLRHLAAGKGLDVVFDRLSSTTTTTTSSSPNNNNNKTPPRPLDALIGPADSYLYDYATAGGYNIATLPLGKLHYRLGLPGAGGGGRPFGLVAVGRPGEEGLRRLVKVVSAWEATWARRVVPDLEGLPSGRAV
jgi:amidase